MKKRPLQFTFRNRQLIVLLMMYEIRFNGNSLRIFLRYSTSRRENTSRGHIQLQMYPRTHATGKARTSTRTDNCSDRSIGGAWSGPKWRLRSLGSGGCAPDHPKCVSI